ncbi:MAG TPA: flagellar hook-associated protein FlgL [Chloroflexota bacterium]|nr:flagellar hook-associated protein FlgL [Chloroflexota bacterium]
MPRVTERLLVDKLLSNIQTNGRRFERLQEEIATGRRIIRPSDDPTGTVTSLVLRSKDGENAQAQKNIDLAMGWLNATDMALQDVSTIVQRVRELVVQGANETLSKQDRAALASEVDQLLEHSMQIANTRYGDRYIFGGYSTRTQPFTWMLGADGVTKVDSNYSGDTGQIVRHVAPGVQLSINTPGSEVFPQVFDALIAIRDDLRANDTNSLSLNRLDELEKVHDDVLDALLSQVGSKGARLDLTKKQISASRLNDAEVLTETEDADMSESIIRLNAQQAALQAALATGARVVQSTLIDFLR